MVWPKSAGERVWASNRQGLEVPRTLSLVKTDTRKGKSKYRIHQETERSTGRGEADEQGKGDRRTQHKPLRNIRGLGRQSRPKGGGAGMRMMEAGRRRKGTSDVRTSVADRELGAG